MVTSDAAGQQWNSSIWDPVAGTSLLTFKGSTSAPHTLSILNNEYILGALPTKSVIQVWSLQKTVRFKTKHVQGFVMDMNTSF